MRVVIQQSQSVRRDLAVWSLLVLFAVLTIALLLLPGRTH